MSKESCPDDIGRAQDAMPGGYVVVAFFVTLWRSQQLVEVPDVRQWAIDRLVADE